MTKHILKIFDRNQGFYSKGILFSLTSLLAAFINFALYPAVAHILSVGNFGEFSALLALITQIGSIMLAFNIISIYMVSKFGEETSKQYLSVIQKGLVITVFMLSIVTIVLFPLIGNLLKISSFSDLLILAAILLCTIPAAVWSGYFQGNGELVRVGVFSLFSAAVKLVFAVIFAVQWGLSGALLGVLIGTIVGLLIFWLLPGNKPPLIDNVKIKNSDLAVFRKFMKIIVRSVIAVGILSLVQVIDLLSIKIHFNSVVAGQYAGISTLSRIVFYLGFIIVWVLVPEIAKATSKHRSNLIRKSYLVYFIISAISMLCALLAGKQILSITLGENYVASIGMVLWAVVFQSSILFVTFQSFVILVLNKNILLPLTIGVIGLLFCFYTLNNNPLNLIRGYALCTIVLSVGLGILISRQAENEETTS